MRLNPLTPAFAAEIVDVDDGRPLEPDSLVLIKQALLDHGLVVLRNQHLDARQQIALTRQFGPPEVFPEHPRYPGLPEIFPLSNKEVSGYLNVGHYWHSDGSFRKNPSALTLFYSEIQPKKGGDTMFSSLHRAYETLPVEVQRHLEQLNTFHRGDGVIHPLISIHPESGRKALYINLGLMGGVVGMTPGESEKLFGFLQAKLDESEGLYRHQYRPGDLVVVDNVAVAHQATVALDSSLRVMRRTTVQGGPLTAARDRQVDRH